MDDIFQRIRFLNLVLGPEKRLASIVFTFTVLAAFVECVGLWLILPILQVIVEGGLRGRFASALSPFLPQLSPAFLLPFLCVLFLVLIVLKIGFTLARTYFTRRFVQQIRLRWLETIFGKYLRAQYDFMLDHKQGELLNNLIQETYKGATCLSQIMEFVARLVLLLVLYVSLLAIHWQSTLLLSVVVVGILFFTHKVSRNFSLRTGRRSIELNQQLSAWGAEGIAALRQIKTYGLETWFCREFVQLARQLFRVQLRFDIAAALPPPLGELALGFLLVMGLLYLHFFTDVVLRSLLPALGLFVVVGQRLVGNTTAIAGMRLSILSLMPSLSLAHNLNGLSIVQEDLATGEHFTQLKEEIKFHDVYFSYGHGKKVLSGLHITILHKKMTALVGSSGSGKSTVADLLFGLVKAQQGQIIINGKDISEWNLMTWRNKMGYVSQEPFLFNMSVRDNIALGKTDATDGAILDAAQKAYAHDFIVRLPLGYETLVGDRGQKLSGGERQRIAIARAIIRNPDFLIFDEATSALDDESERLVQRAILELGKEKTILIIAHRLSTIAEADVVYDLDKLNDVLRDQREPRQASLS